MSTEKDNPQGKGPGYREFISLMAVIISITALAIDIMLPALPDIGRDLGVRHPNDAQLVVTFLMLGMGCGQILFGPLSDCFGRKPVILAGFLIFIVGCMISIFSTRFDIMLAGRLIQGLGAAGPRTTIVALIRDLYGGRAMARIMSVIMTIFILVPAVAPGLGQILLLAADWRFIFGLLMVQGLVSMIWFCIRQPETLLKVDRRPFSPAQVLGGFTEVAANRVSLGYTLASGFISGALLAYLNCAQQVYQEVFGLGREFPLYMAFLALSVGSASFVNSRIVMRIGMRALSRRAVVLFIVMSAFYLVVTFMMGGHSPLWFMMTCFTVAFFCMGILFGNQNAIAMEPLSHIAGIGAAVIGCLASLISSLTGMVVGRYFDGTTLPLAVGFVLLGILTAAAMYWADSGGSTVPD